MINNRHLCFVCSCLLLAATAWGNQSPRRGSSLDSPIPLTGTASDEGVRSANRMADLGVDVLGAPDAKMLAILNAGADVPIPVGTRGLTNMMSQLTLRSRNEVALLRLQDGSRILRMGTPTSVTLGIPGRSPVTRIIAHTHPSGRIGFSRFDVAALMKRGQASSVIIDPNVGMGARLPVPVPGR